MDQMDLTYTEEDALGIDARPDQYGFKKRWKQAIDSANRIFDLQDKADYLEENLRDILITFFENFFEENRETVASKPIDHPLIHTDRVHVLSDLERAKVKLRWEAVIYLINHKEEVIKYFRAEMAIRGENKIPFARLDKFILSHIFDEVDPYIDSYSLDLLKSSGSGDDLDDQEKYQLFMSREPLFNDKMDIYEHGDVELYYGRLLSLISGYLPADARELNKQRQVVQAELQRLQKRFRPSFTEWGEVKAQLEVFLLREVFRNRITDLAAAPAEAITPVKVIAEMDYLGDENKITNLLRMYFETSEKGAFSSFMSSILGRKTRKEMIEQIEAKLSPQLEPLMQILYSLVSTILKIEQLANQKTEVAHLAISFWQEMERVIINNRQALKGKGLPLLMEQIASINEQALFAVNQLELSYR